MRRINAFRHAGVVESSFLINEMTVEIIADGKHLPESLLKLIYKSKGSDKICLITDSIMATNFDEGEYTDANGQKIIVEDGIAKLLDRTSFAGSIATSNILIKNMIEIADVPLIEAVKMATLTPARVMGLEKRKGMLSCGKDADIVIFDKDINVLMVMVEGNVRINKI